MSNFPDQSGDSESVPEPNRRFASGRVLVVGFDGWTDPCGVVTDTVRHLKERFEGTHAVLAELTDEMYYDYSVARPLIRMNETGERMVVWPSASLFGPQDEREEASPAHNLAADAELHVLADEADIFVLSGVEPTLRLASFIERIMEFVEEADVSRVVLIGGMLDESPHTRPANILLTSDFERVRDEFGAVRSTYEGLTGVLGILDRVLTERGRPTLGVWASVPHYAQGPHSPKVVSAILDKLEEVLDISLPHAAVAAEAEAWERDVNELMSQDDDMREYVAMLERNYDTVKAPEASGDAIAREFERFLSAPPKGFGSAHLQGPSLAAGGHRASEDSPAPSDAGARSTADATGVSEDAPEAPGGEAAPDSSAGPDVGAPRGDDETPDSGSDAPRA